MNLNEYIGIPFRNRGRTREEGFDCWGLVVDVQRELFGRDLPSLDDQYASAYDRETVRALIDTTQPEIGAVNVESPETGDIAVIAFDGRPCHVGVYVHPGLILHTERGKESVLERVAALGRRARIVGYYRVD